MSIPYGPDGFSAALDSIRRTLCIGHEGCLLALQKYFNEMDVSTMLMIDPTLARVSRPALLQTYADAQTEEMDDAADKLKQE